MPMKRNSMKTMKRQSPMAFVPTGSLSARGAPVRSAKCSSFSGARLQQARLGHARAARWSANISSNDFKTGTTIELEGEVFRVNEFQHVKPGKGAAFVRTKLKNMKSGATLDKTFRAGINVATATLEKIKMQHTYVDGSDYAFMNMETYEEERMTKEMLGDNMVKFLLEGMEVQVLKHDADVLGIEMEKVISYTVTSTDPGVKGNTAQGGGLKPCTIESGATVMVPLFINEGEKIKVSTETGKYMNRDTT